MRRLVFSSHQVDGIAARGEEEELENGIIWDIGEGPKEI